MENSLFYAAQFGVIFDGSADEFPYTIDLNGRRTHLRRSEVVELRDSLSLHLNDASVKEATDTLTIYAVDKHALNAIRFVRSVGTLRGQPLGLREAKDAVDKLATNAIPSIKIENVPVAARSVIQAAAQSLGVSLEPPLNPFIPASAVL